MTAKRRFSRVGCEVNVRGAPALISKDGSIEVYVENTAISLAGDDPALLKRAAEALRPVPRSHLPPRGGQLTELPNAGPPPRLMRLRRPPRVDLRSQGARRFNGKRCLDRNPEVRQAIEELHRHLP